MKCQRNSKTAKRTVFHLTIYQNSVQECLHDFSNDDQHCYHNSSCLTWSVKLYSDHSDLEPEPLKQKISKISKFQKGRGWSVRVQSVSLGQLIGVCARERDGAKTKIKLLPARWAERMGESNERIKHEKMKGKKERDLANVINIQKKRRTICSGRYSQRQSDGLEKKMKGTTYQKEWYTMLRWTRSTNLQSSVLLEINFFLLVAALFMGHH